MSYAGEPQGDTVIQASSTGLKFIAADPATYTIKAQSSHSTTQSIPDATDTALTFDTEDYDTNSMYSGGAPTRLTINTSGTFRIEAKATFDTNIVGDYYILIRKNGSTTIAQSATVPAEETNALVITTSAALVSTDYIEVLVNQTSGGSLNVIAGAYFNAGLVPIAVSGPTLGTSIAQTAHGLAVGNVIRFNGTNYVKAQGDTAANAEVVGVVASVPNANTFTFVATGYITGLSSLTAGSVYFLSSATAGLLTTTEPSGSGQVSKPILQAITTTAGWVYNMRGMTIPSSVDASDIACRVYNSADISVATGGAYLTFDSERFDTNTMHSTSSNTGRITFTTAGKYVIGGSIEFASSAVGNRAIAIRLNGSTTIARHSTVNIGAVQQLSIASEYDFAANDYIELFAFQDSGVAVNVNATSNLSPEFWASKIPFSYAGGFQVSSGGDITKINNVTTTWPASQGAENSVLRNNGSGTLTWVTDRVAKISETILGSTASSVTFSSIPGTYQNLLIECMTRGDASSGEVGTSMTFNGSSSGYSYTRMYTTSSGSTPGQDRSTSDSKMDLGATTAATSTSNIPAHTKITVGNYAQTTFSKSVIVECQCWDEGSNGRLYHNGGTWNNTAAITSITISVASGNFIAGSTFTLYGMY